MLGRYGYLMVLMAVPVLAAAADSPAPAVSDAKASVPDSAKAKRAVPEKFCVRETGTRIPGQCLAGQVITREELERAGGTSLAETLPRLSPALQRGGH